jgi:plasmid stability protein
MSTTTFTVKQVPQALANRLRRRAADNHRSLQRELLLILESAVASDEPLRARISEPAAAYSHAPKPAQRRVPAAKAGKLSLEELWQRSRRMGAKNTSESTDLIRRDRDARHSH